MARFDVYLKRAIRQRGWSQRSLAARVDVSPNTVSDWMSGLRKPRPETLAKLAPVLDVPLLELMTVVGYNLRPGEQLPEPNTADLSAEEVTYQIDSALKILTALRAYVAGRPNGDPVAC